MCEWKTRYMMINQHQGFIKEVTMIITMKRKSVIEFNKIKGTRVNLQIYHIYGILVLY